MHKKDLVVSVSAKGREVMEWACPHFGYRNTGLWKSRGNYASRQCKKVTTLTLPPPQIIY
jgi:hypothetical protein